MIMSRLQSKHFYPLLFVIELPVRKPALQGQLFVVIPGKKMKRIIILERCHSQL